MGSEIAFPSTTLVQKRHPTQDRFRNRVSKYNFTTEKAFHHSTQYRVRNRVSKYNFSNEKVPHARSVQNSSFQVQLLYRKGTPRKIGSEIEFPSTTFVQKRHPTQHPTQDGFRIRVSKYNFSTTKAPHARSVQNWSFQVQCQYRKGTPRNICSDIEFPSTTSVQKRHPTQDGSRNRVSKYNHSTEKAPHARPVQKSSFQLQP